MAQKVIDEMFLGEDGRLLPELRRFNWGAFFLNWIWGLGNNTYITLIVFVFAFVPFVNILNLFLGIWFGIKGNEWALTNKKWESIEHFQRVQKNWAIASLVIIFLAALATVIIPEIIS